MKKLFALLLACAMVLSLAACGGAPAASAPASESAGSEAAAPAEDILEEAAPAEETEEFTAPEAEGEGLSFPLCEPGEITLTWMEGLIPDALNIVKPDNSQNVLYRELEKLSGVHLDFKYENTEMFMEKFSLMLAAQDYPDIASAAPDMCDSSGDAAYENGVIVNLNDYPDLIQNYLAAINTEENGYRNAVTDEGNLLCFAQIYDKLQPNFCGYQIRQNWLEDLGLDVPETIDDWHEMLVRFRDEKTGGEAPMDMAATGLPDMNWFASAYGLNITGISQKFFVQRDGVVSCSVTEDAFRDYLETMSGWYADGLINKDFISGTGFAGLGYGPDDPRLAEGKSGAFPALYSMSGSFFANTGMAEAGTFTCMVAQPTLERGVPNKIGAHGTDASRIVAASGDVVFASGDHVEEAIALIDYLYSEEGAFLRTYGVEGETFEYDADGKPVYTNMIVDNPDMVFAVARQVYLRHNGSMYLLEAEEQASSDPYALTYYDVWNNIGEWNLDGNITYTADENAERAALMADIETYVGEYAAKVIAGMTPLNDDTWNDYLSTMEQMNIDRVTEITQDAYDRYLAR